MKMVKLMKLVKLEKTSVSSERLEGFHWKFLEDTLSLSLEDTFYIFGKTTGKSNETKTDHPSPFILTFLGLKNLFKNYITKWFFN